MPTNKRDNDTQSGPSRSSLPPIIRVQFYPPVLTLSILGTLTMCLPANLVTASKSSLSTLMSVVRLSDFRVFRFLWGAVYTLTKDSGIEDH